jgi:hypothetical protein
MVTNMMTPQPTSIKVTTPIGTAKWPYLIEPDTKFNADGEYRIELVLDAGDEAEALFASISAFRDKAAAEYKKLGGGKAVKIAPTFPVVRNEDGSVSVKAKLKAKVTSKSGRSWEQRPAIFDAKGNPIKSEIRIGSGSRVRLSIELSPFNSPAIGGCGVSVRLRGVQVIEIREPKATSASDFGFGAEETGFVTETFDNFEDDAKTTGKQGAKADF